MFATVIIVYITLSTIFNQSYKVTTRTMKNATAQTVGLQLVAAVSCLLLVPFFSLKLPSNPLVYLFLGLSCIFYAINNRILANVRKNIEASTISILQQSHTVLMTLAGFLLYAEEITLFKVLGIILIIGGNILVFWQRGKTQKIDKYVWFGLLAYLCNVIAGLIDVGYSKQFNLAFYTTFLYLIPATLIFITNRVKIIDIRKEFKRANKKFFFITGFCWGVAYLTLLVAYSMAEVSLVSPLASLTVFTNVIAGYIWLNERKNLPKKIIAAALAILGIVFISL